MGASERHPWESNVAPHGAAFEIDDLLSGGQEIVPGRGCLIGDACLARQARVPSRSDNVQQERPAVHLAVDHILVADGRNDVVEHVFRDVVVPWLDDAGFLHRRHFHERRLADIDVPGAFTGFRLGHEALDPEALDGRDLVVDPREFGVHVRDCGMKVLDPLIERRRQRPVGGKSRADAGFHGRRDAGHAEARDQAPREKLTPVDRSLQQLPAQ